MYTNLRLKLPGSYSVLHEDEFDINPMPVEYRVVITDFIVLPTGESVVLDKGLFHDFILAN